MSRRHLWVLAVGASLLAFSCSQSYTNIKNIRCPTDLLCPGGLICLNGYCVDQHSSSSGGSIGGFSSTGMGGGSSTGGTCVSCPEMFLQGSANGCDNSSAELFNEIKSCACDDGTCDTSDTCQSNLCNSGITLPTSGGIGGIGGGGMSEQCEACVADNCSGPFNMCAFDPANGHGTTGTVTTGSTGFGGSTGTTGFNTTTGTNGTANCLSEGTYCNDTNEACCSPYTCNDGECSPVGASTTGSTGGNSCQGAGDSCGDGIECCDALPCNEGVCGQFGTTGSSGSSGSSGGGNCVDVTVDSLCASTNLDCGNTTADCSLDGSSWTCYATTICSTTATNSCNCATGSFTYTCASGTPCSADTPCGGSNASYSCRTPQETQPGCTDSLSEVAGTCNCVGGSSITVRCGQTGTCAELCGEQ